MSALRHIPRDTLLRRILASPAPIVVIEAPVGTGKTRLMQDLARLTGARVATGLEPPAAEAAGADPAAAPPPGAAPALWDVPHVAQSGPLPADPRGRLILAKRPGTAIPGLARATVFGQVERIAAADLLLNAADLAAAGLDPEAAAAVLARSGGWACLLPGLADGEAGLRDIQAAQADFLRDEMLSHYPSAALAAFEIWLDAPGRPVDPRLLAGLPFVDPAAPLHPALAAVRQPLTRALRAILAARSRDPTEARAVAVTQAALGRPFDAVTTFQSVGAWQAALATLRQADGPFAFYRMAPDRFGRMIDGFPPDLLREDETLVLCRAIRAVKQGDVPLSQRIMADRWGEGIADFAAVLQDRATYSFDLRYFRLILKIWEDFTVRDDFLDLAYPLLAEIPAGEDLRRGSFHNTVLEIYIRTGRLSEAEVVAMRAQDHYLAARVPILSFFIDLHLGIIRLMQGDTAAARRHAAAGRRHLDESGFASASDRRLLALLTASIDYETGKADGLLKFLTLDLDALTRGEIWPSLAEFALTYGSQALADSHGPLAARAFLDRWRVRQEQSLQFRRLIDTREIVLLQGAGRWAEAARKAERLPGRITRDLVLADETGLAGLTDHDEIATALIWLRQLAQTAPRTPGLVERIDRMIGNIHVTNRQRTAALVWRAHVLRRQRRLPEAEAALAGVLGLSARAGTVASLAEERMFLADLLSSRPLREAAERDEGIRRHLRLTAAPGQGRSDGLTRQETRILRAIGEGSANKAIGNMLGISESTVKFHLVNLYRKLGVADRRQAVAAARALRMIA